MKFLVGLDLFLTLTVIVDPKPTQDYLLLCVCVSVCLSVCKSYIDFIELTPTCQNKKLYI